MSKTILGTRPNHDAATDYLYHWSEVVMRQATEKHFKVLDLKGEKANRKNFTSYIQSKQPAFIFINGHGAADMIAGYDDEALLTIADGATPFIRGTRPIEDPMAGLFLEPSNLVAMVLIKGHSARVAYDRSQAAMQKNFRKTIVSAASFEERMAAACLWSNMKGQVLVGDGGATI